MKPAKEHMDFINYLSPNIRTVCDRKKFVVDFCVGKNVLHIGCVGSGDVEAKIENKTHLHYRLDQVSKSLIGIDINWAGIEILIKKGDFNLDHF